MTEAELRSHFESAMLDVARHARKAGTAVDDNGSPITSEALFWKDERGLYGVRQFNAAWTGFLAGYALGIKQ